MILPALIIEPVLGNIGPVLPGFTYLREVREITKAHDVLLIFDEVITGYRIGIGGAQVYFGVRPDITTLGKNRRRRPSDRGVCGTTRDYGMRFPLRPGIPGRHILRKPSLALCGHCNDRLA